MTKTLTFAATHFTIAFSVAYLVTGSYLAGGALAILEPSVNTIAYLIHEKIWQKTERKKTVRPVQLSPTRSVSA